MDIPSVICNILQIKTLLVLHLQKSCKYSGFPPSALHLAFHVRSTMTQSRDECWWYYVTTLVYEDVASFP